MTVGGGAGKEGTGEAEAEGGEEEEGRGGKAEEGGGGEAEKGRGGTDGLNGGGSMFKTMPTEEPMIRPQFRPDSSWRQSAVAVPVACREPHSL